MGNKIQIISWNMDFWRRTCGNTESEYYKSDEEISLWKNNAQHSLAQLNTDFLLLQEINPLFLYNIKSENYSPPFYKVHTERKNIFYHELAKKYFLGLGNLYWGTSIIADRKYTLLKRNFIDNDEYQGEKYYAQNSLMCYDFELPNGEKITIINHYHKGRNWDYNYSDIFFKNIEYIYNINKANLMLFAGDFNASCDDEKTKETFEAIEHIGFLNCTKNIGTTIDLFDNP
jgi:hypothetical protein